MAKEINILLPQKLTCMVYGSGPAIVLFHPSPNSSKMMEPLAMLLSDHYTVICPDTPGYGKSEKLDEINPSIKDYVRQFKLLLQHLKIESCALYGSATGAQIAIRFGIEYPESVSHLYLDNCAHFTDEERNSIKKNYFPDLSPDVDGTHLSRVWDIVYHLFKYFPWCFKDDDHKLDGPLPSAEVLHGIVLDYLKAGAAYHLAYSAAFDHEKAAYIQKLSVPTTIFRWEGSILKKYTDRIFEYDLSNHIKGVMIPADRIARNSAMAAHIIEQHNGESHYSADDLEQKFQSVSEPFGSENDATAITELPPPEASGFYLKEAWNNIRKSLPVNSQMNAEQLAIQIQKCLIFNYNHYYNS